MFHHPFSWSDFGIARSQTVGPCEEPAHMGGDAFARNLAAPEHMHWNGINNCTVLLECFWNSQVSNNGI